MVGGSTPYGVAAAATSSSCMIEQRSCHGFPSRRAEALPQLLPAAADRRPRRVFDVREELLRALPQQPRAKEDHERRVDHACGGALLRTRRPGIRSHRPSNGPSTCDTPRRGAASSDSWLRGRRSDVCAAVVRKKLNDDLRIHGLQKEVVDAQPPRLLLRARVPVTTARQTSAIRGSATCCRRNSSPVMSANHQSSSTRNLAPAREWAVRGSNARPPACKAGALPLS